MWTYETIQKVKIIFYFWANQAKRKEKKDADRHKKSYLKLTITSKLVQSNRQNKRVIFFL